MTSLALTVRETLRYRGAIGQWSWVLHRLTGLGVVLFLYLHVIDTSWAVFFPKLYVEAIATYQSPLFTIGEFGLVFAVVYHALNGLRIILFDFKPHLWQYQQRAAFAVLGLTILILIPVFLGMLGHVLEFYGNSEPFLPLDRVLFAQLPFAGGFVIAAVVALLLSGAYGVVAGEMDGTPGFASRLERFWWSFMRISGLLIVPLVFGHLALMHIAQGVFDITLQESAIVGTQAVNSSGTAVEFVQQRWGFLLAGVAFWKVYDFALLSLVVIHGFNGLRYVLTDYTASSQLARRAAVYLCTIGAVVLLVLGSAALFSTIDESNLALAVEETQRLTCDITPEEEQPDFCASLAEEGADETNSD